MSIVNTGNKGGYVTARFIATGVLYPNNATDGANSVGETVETLKFSFIGATGNSSANWVVKRGANTVFNISGGQSLDLIGEALSVEVGGEAAANVVATLTGGPSTLIIKMHKSSSFTTEY